MNEILKLLGEASDSALLMSRFNCHVQGLHSIVLSENDGMLVRCFLADRTHRMHTNKNGSVEMSLGIHNHHYDIRLKRISGSLFNIVYARGGKYPTTYRRWLYNLDRNSGSKIITDTYVDVGLSVKSCTRLSESYMLSEDLHTVYVPEGQKASWLVYEGAFLTEQTELFLPRSVNPVCEFTKAESADQVRNFVNNFYGD